MTSVARRREHDSGDYSDASHPDIEEHHSGNDGGQVESDYESPGSESDRSDAQDNENQEQERRVDDDEDRSNPQYIPKRGTFYEHDDRTAASGEESSNTASEVASEKKEPQETTERRRGPRKGEGANKWSHDKYNENEQMPKSRDELVAIYGYDIRNEDAPPHARRNRRYGRGPNKYTRTWEDEEAYRRQAAAPPAPRKPPQPEDFPDLGPSQRPQKKRTPRPRSKSQPSSTESIENGNLRRNASIKAKGKPSPRQGRNPVKSPPQSQNGPKEKIENITITATVFNNSQSAPIRKMTVTPAPNAAQMRPVPTDLSKRRPQQNNQNTSSPARSPPAPKPKAEPPQAPPGNAAGAEPRGGSKRYSSLRQRPLDNYPPNSGIQPHPTGVQHATGVQPHPTGVQPHSTGVQPHPTGVQPHSTGVQQTSQNAGVPQTPVQAVAAPPGPNTRYSDQYPGQPPQGMAQMVRTASINQQPHGPSPPHQQIPQQPIPQQPLQQQPLQQQPLPQPPLQQQPLQQQNLQQQHSQQVRLGIIDQQQLVSHPHHSMHNMPQPHNIGQMQPAQGYAPPAMMPAQYMQQSGSGGVYSAGMFAAPPPPAPYPHQMYPHHNYVHPPAPAGLTYYSCAEQEQPPRAPRRPTAAIPIVRPAQPDRPANSTEKDNIDRIVENMFVRKPWPAAQSDQSKEKSESRSSQESQSKESPPPDSLTSSSISTDSKPSETKEEKEEVKEEKVEEEKKVEEPPQESITTEA